MRPLENLADIQQVAKSLLQLADVDEQLPTPVDDVVAAAGLLEVDDYALSDGKISQAPRELRRLLRGAARKIRGALDRRERILHISPEIEIPAQRKFVECHEVMHDALPWRKDLLVLVDTQMFRVPPDLDGVHRLWPEGHNATRWTSLANPARQNPYC